jgi:hypothetical protein
MSFQDTIKERWSICESCEHFKEFPIVHKVLKVGHQCEQCGCFMEAKVRIPQMHCPLEKW